MHYFRAFRLRFAPPSGFPLYLFSPSLPPPSPASVSKRMPLQSLTQGCDEYRAASHERGLPSLLKRFLSLAKTQSNAENYFATLCAFARIFRTLKKHPWDCSIPVETSHRGVFKEKNSCKTIFYKN